LQAATKGFNGGGIYDSSNDFSLDTNTLVLFVFCLACALVLSYSYVMLARSSSPLALIDLVPIESNIDRM